VWVEEESSTANLAPYWYKNHIEYIEIIVGILIVAIIFVVAWFIKKGS
jgi:hypothetical protein